MTEDAESTMLDMLRRIRASQERTELDVADVKVRMSALEQHQGQAVLQRVLGTLSQRWTASTNDGRIERRLDWQVVRTVGWVTRSARNPTWART